MNLNKKILPLYSIDDSNQYLNFFAFDKIEMKFGKDPESSGSIKLAYNNDGYVVITSSEYNLGEEKIGLYVRLTKLDERTFTFLPISKCKIKSKIQKRNFFGQKSKWAKIEQESPFVANSEMTQFTELKKRIKKFIKEGYEIDNGWYHIINNQQTDFCYLQAFMHLLNEQKRMSFEDSLLCLSLSDHINTINKHITEVKQTANIKADETDASDEDLFDDTEINDEDTGISETSQTKDGGMKELEEVAIKRGVVDFNPGNKDQAEIIEKLKQTVFDSKTAKKLVEEFKLMKEGSSSQMLYANIIKDLPYKSKEMTDYSPEDLLEALNKNHYGLDELKESLLEYFAVQKLTGKPSGTVLCLVGPPGVGKTTISKSIAEAFDLDFCKIAMGGVHDESVLRGFHRSYSGSRPGKLVECLRQIDSKNPVFLLDEVDKISSNSAQGDPSAALLEILDSGQNHSFEDHYLGFPIDLSGVFFIATANDEEKIPPALRDRFEMIHIRQYNHEEKSNITLKYLLGNNAEKCGLDKEKVRINDDALEYLVNHSEREDYGLRKINRCIEKICRGMALDMIQGAKEDCIIDLATLKITLKKMNY